MPRWDVSLPDDAALRDDLRPLVTRGRYAGTAPPSRPEWRRLHGLETLCPMWTGMVSRTALGHMDHAASLALPVAITAILIPPRTRAAPSNCVITLTFRDDRKRPNPGYGTRRAPVYLERLGAVISR
jgi:hypothetical protein